MPVYASGSLEGIADIKCPCDVDGKGQGTEGWICGRAIHIGALDCSSARKRAGELAEEGSTASDVVFDLFPITPERLASGPNPPFAVLNR